MKAVRRWAAEQRLQPLLEVAHNLDDAIKYHADLDRRLDPNHNNGPDPRIKPGDRAGTQSSASASPPTGRPACSCS